VPSADIWVDEEASDRYIEDLDRIAGDLLHVQKRGLDPYTRITIPSAEYMQPPKLMWKRTVCQHGS